MSQFVMILKVLRMKKLIKCCLFDLRQQESFLQDHQFCMIEYEFVFFGVKLALFAHWYTLFIFAEYNNKN